METWRGDLEIWLAPFVAALGHKIRGRMCPAYVAGLIGPGDRKSVQPMAARDRAISYDQLHHFIADGVWDSAPLEAALLAEADRLVGGEEAFLVIDDTCLPKKGERSVGVAPQYASSLGKTANCQSLVSVTLASGEVPVTVGLRLFLPEVWTNDPDRMARARVPKDRQTALSKPEIAIEEIDRARAAGVRFGCVLADAGYGSSGSFRQALSARGLTWAVGLSRRQNIYPADVGLTFPEAGRGRRRKHHLPDRMAVSAEQMLEEGAFTDAAETFAAIAEEDPASNEAWAGVVRAHLAAGEADAAQAALDQIPASAASSAPVEAARAQLHLARQAAKAGPLDALQAKVDADPDDQPARLEYAQALHAAGRVEDAIDILLDSFRRDRDWNEGAAKAQLLTIFDSLKPNDPLVQKGRRRLSSLIFA